MARVKAAKAKKQSLAANIVRHRERGKQHYEEADRLLDELLAACDVGEKIKLSDGREVELIDNFAGKNKVFRSHGIARFELKVHEARPVLPAE